VSAFDLELTQRLQGIRKTGLGRVLRRVDSPQSSRITISGRELLNFSSNDYLGLANQPELKAAAGEAVARYGAGAGASRLISGTLAAHAELEESLAAFKGSEAALTFATGYAAAQGTICALLDRDDVIVIDRLVHACIVDAARLCRAKLRVFPHNDLGELERILAWADRRQAGKGAGVEGRPAGVVKRSGRTLIVTESVFSMDGDQAPLKALVELKDRYGAWLMLDEAHATGLYGANRRGLAEELGVSQRIEVQMGTLGKALGASGGYICGSRAFIDFLINGARSFIFSTAPVPAAAAAASAGVHFVQSKAGALRRDLLWQRVALLNSKLRTENSAMHCAIFPLLIGDEIEAVQAAASLLEQGVFVPAIRYPTVARGQARLRLTVTASHTESDLAELLRALGNLGTRFQPPVS
jgi:7-keto-8-aminopelargonate synthetase-like enzyme